MPFVFKKVREAQLILHWLTSSSYWLARWFQEDHMDNICPSPASRQLLFRGGMSSCFSSCLFWPENLYWFCSFLVQIKSKGCQSPHFHSILIVLLPSASAYVETRNLKTFAIICWSTHFIQPQKRFLGTVLDSTGPSSVSEKVSFTHRYGARGLIQGGLAAKKIQAKLVSEQAI